MRTVTKAFLRYLPRRRSLSVLQLLGISCGVAAAVGMTLAANASLASFSLAVDFLKGRTTHSLTRPAGPMPESLLSRLMNDPAVQAFSPVIDRHLPLQRGDVVRLLGIDPFLDVSIRPELANTSLNENVRGGSQDVLSFLLDERTVLLDDSLARELGVKPGRKFSSARGDFRVVGTFPNPSGEPLILMDISHAQPLFGLRGKIDRVDLILKDPEGFAARWKEGFTLQSGEQRVATLTDMLRAFRLNLEALSLLALFVGVFLIYNTAMFAVVSRRKDAGILMSLGAHRGEILLAFITEILILGGLGGALGGLLGYGLSHFLTELVGGAISNLYFFLRPNPPVWSLQIPLIGVLLGCGASLLGGAFPLLELSRTDPIHALRGRVAGRRGIRVAKRVAWVGLVVFLVSLAILPATAIHVYVGFVSAFGCLLAGSLFAGTVLVVLVPLLKWCFSRLGGLPGKVAAGNIHQNLGRTAVAVAAFMVALSMAIGLGSMIDSFRKTLVWWMGSQLRGDLYIAPSREVGVPEGLVSELRRMTGIGGLDPYRNVQVIYRERPVRITAIDAGVLQKYTKFGWLKGGNENWDPVKKGAVIVSESFHRRFDVGAGDTITLESLKGPTELKVAAVFYDYTTEHGLIMMDRSTYIALYDDPTVDSLVVFMDPDNPHREKILEEVKRRAAGWGIPVAPREKFHAAILEVFDATFAVTRSMRLMAVIVAFFGIAGALLTLFMERQREFGVYRALGFSTGQAAVMTFMEGLGMGLVSFALSVGVGTVLALILIRAINLHSFHWTIFFYPDWGPYLLAAGTAVLASVGAAAYPIWRVCRTYPQIQIREE